MIKFCRSTAKRSLRYSTYLSVYPVLHNTLRLTSTAQESTDFTISHKNAQNEQHYQLYQLESMRYVQLVARSRCKIAYSDGTPWVQKLWIFSNGVVTWGPRRGPIFPVQLDLSMLSISIARPTKIARLFHIISLIITHPRVRESNVNMQHSLLVIVTD